MIKIIGVDPGTVETAFVVYDPVDSVSPVQSVGYVSNEEFLLALRSSTIVQKQVPHIFVFEYFESMGMALGREAIETICWTGRFMEASQHWHRLYRTEIKLHLTGSRRSKDPNVRRVLLDRFGGDAAKRAGGKLVNVKSHLWSALAVAVTYAEAHCPMFGSEG